MSTYTIKEVSRMFRLPASTLRYYEEEGLLKNVGRTPDQQRIYEERHISRLETILCFKGTGMTIAQLRQLFQYEEEEEAHIDDILALLLGQREHVVQELRKMQENLAHVERKISRYTALRDSMQGPQKGG